jgi:hypothetical protein
VHNNQSQLVEAITCQLVEQASSGEFLLEVPRTHDSDTRTEKDDDSIRGVSIKGLIAIGEIAKCSKTSKRRLERILSKYGLILDARKTGPPATLVMPRSCLPPPAGKCLCRWGMVAKKRKLRMGSVPYSGARLHQKTLVRATGRRPGVLESMRVLAVTRSRVGVFTPP